MLLPSSSIVEGASLGAISELAELDFSSLSDFLCRNSCRIPSTGTALRMFSVAVGRRARVVYVQSSWFCEKRLRRLR